MIFFFGKLSTFLRPLGSQNKLYKLQNFDCLVDVAADRNASVTCPSVKNHFFKKKNDMKRKQKKKKRENEKNTKKHFSKIKKNQERKKKEREASNGEEEGEGGVLPRRLKKMFPFKKKKTWYKKSCSK